MAVGKKEKQNIQKLLKEAQRIAKEEKLDPETALDEAYRRLRKK